LRAFWREGIAANNRELNPPNREAIMADQRKSPDIQMKFQATRLATIKGPEFKLGADFVEQLVDLIDPLPETSRTFVSTNIIHQARNYHRAGAIAEAFATPKQSRAALKRLDRPFRTMIETIDQLSMDYQFVLDAMLGKEMGRNGKMGSLLSTRLDIEKLQTAVRKVLENYKPKGGAESLTHLEQCVGALMLLFEVASGKRPTASITCQGEHCPRTTSPQAEAIVLLLTRVNQSLEEVSIISKIVRIGHRYRGKTLAHYAPQLWLPNQQVTPIPAPSKT
jgi:hypothetical protein